MKLTEDEPKSIEIENGIVKITFVNDNPYNNKIDENPVIRTIEFKSDTLQKIKEDAEKLKRIEESGGKLMDKYCYKTAKSDREIVEHMKNFFNADNVLTKSEYKQKILFQKPDPELNCPCEYEKPCGLHKIQFFSKKGEEK